MTILEPRGWEIQCQQAHECGKWWSPDPEGEVFESVKICDAEALEAVARELAPNWIIDSNMHFCSPDCLTAYRAHRGLPDE